MKRDQIVAFLLSAFLLILWLGFLVHRDDRFAGSFTGAVLALCGSSLLLVPLVYSFIKRISFLKRAITKRISLSTLLAIHIYGGFLGAILVLLHTGHKFHGLLPTILTALLLVLVFSGYTGRYLLGYLSKSLSEKRQLLLALQSQYDLRIAGYRADKNEREVLGFFSGFFSNMLAAVIRKPANSESSFVGIKNILSLTDAISDVEYAISSHELMKRLFSSWLRIHLVLSFFFYLVLVAHVGSEYYFGLRWFL